MATTGPERVPLTLAQIVARGRLRALIAMLGPAFVAATGYLDPGNFVTNVQGGAGFGYQLVWVVVLANLVAMPIQYLSAKLGIVTGRSMPELCRERYPQWVSWLLWAQAEVVAMATDLAEFVGAVTGLNLLFGLPRWLAMVITAALAFAICELRSQGHRSFELAVGALLAVVLIGLAYETFRIGPDLRSSVDGLVPTIGGSDSMLLIAGIVGATVMPHVIYLHSALVTSRVHASNDAERSRVLRFERVDVCLALGLAGLLNLSMLLAAARLLHGNPAAAQDATLLQMHSALESKIGGLAALAFAVALLASGVSSSSVGTLAGQVIIQGFVGIRIPLQLRRAATMLPAVVLLSFGFDPTRALVISQVVLSFGIPFALVPLIRLTSDHRFMGVHVNRPALALAMVAIVSCIVIFNLLVLGQQFFG